MSAEKKRFIPVWQLVLAGALLVLIVIGVVFAGSFLTNRHRASIVEVSQDRVSDVSEVVKKYGTPQLSNEAKKSGNHLTILFYYDGYQDETKALRQIGLMQGALKNTQPFASSEVIATKIITSGSDRCKVERRAQNILVCDKGLINEINKLNIEHFKLVILSPKDFVPNAKVTRGKNSALYLPAHQGVLTEEELNVFLTRFFLHEIGHTFGLRDEYAFERSGSQNYEAVSDNVAYQAARPNCAPDRKTAETWWGSYAKAIDKVDYQAGCAGNKTFYYPQSDTVMSANPQDADYGKVSEDYLRGALDCFYGQKDTISYLKSDTAVPGRVEKCNEFRQLYPKFWRE